MFLGIFFEASSYVHISLGFYLEPGFQTEVETTPLKPGWMIREKEKSSLLGLLVGKKTFVHTAFQMKFACGD